MKDIDISLLRDIDKQKKSNLLTNRRDILNAKINVYLSSQLKKDFSTIICKDILKMPDKTLADIEMKEWLFNNGNFRTEQEFLDYKEHIDNENYFNSNNYQVDLYRLWWLPPIPMIIWLIWLTTGLCTMDLDIIVPCIFSLIIFIILSCLLGVLVSAIRISIINKHGTPNDPRYKKQVFNAKTGFFSLLGSLFIIGRHSKNNLKSIMNPDSWHEMK